jgi:branched-subunit amino acid transport protein AzlD
MADLYEYDEVRKLSAEICARLLPFLVTSRLVNGFIVNIKEKNMMIAKVFLFSLCSQTVLYERSLEPYGINELIPVLFDVLKLRCPPPTATG